MDIRSALQRGDDRSPATPPHARLDQRRARCLSHFRRVRDLSLRLTAPLLPEDFRLQSMEDVSPPYWNLGHTSWFFAANVLQPRGRMPAGFDGFDFALNSYYEGLGPRLERGRRGQVAAPTTDAVHAYRRCIDDAMVELLETCSEPEFDELEPIVRIGCQHEQQHQELFVTEILHIRWSAPPALRRGYLETTRSPSPTRSLDPGPLRACGFDGASTTLGYQGRPLADGGFCWDNELPAHAAVVQDFALADRLITNAEWLAFVRDGGYREPLLWLSNGWDFVRREGLEAPLYWLRDGHGGFSQFTLFGEGELDPHAPVCHVSFYEADAFARWFGAQRRDWQRARLPRECEWEHAARTAGYSTGQANLLDRDLGHSAFITDPVGPPPAGQPTPRQLAGTAWEWTQSHYEPYPGYRPFDGALMEYNGKFMDNQRVLRGGSFATPRTSARVAYRNFWAPTTRFQASSVRLLVD